MADIVQRNLEDMVPDLLEFVNTDVFTEEEVKEIIRNRRHHEYKLIRISPSKKNFFQAVQYELSLESKRNRNQIEMNIKPSALDRSIINRIHSIFRRFVAAFKHDVTVWKEYINYCVRSKSDRQLNKLLGKSLQMHPKEIDFWLIAMHVETDIKKNTEGGRKILQRSVQVNQHSLKLWNSYLKFEKMYGTEEIYELVLSYATGKCKDFQVIS